jgi:hypothetical protein
MWQRGRAPAVHTAYKWLGRANETAGRSLRTGARGLSAAPGGCAVERVVTMAALRRVRISLSVIALVLSLSLPSVTNELRRLGLNKVSRLEPGPPVVRYGI